ncbi:MAG: oligosaccharide flippase family protein [Candidatus Latescibacterota bacterium]|nr:MAG: oligosaccharide flippase family protein [Candidatus Latescibacterota bacterium]
MGETTRQVGHAVFWSVLSKTSRFVLGIASSVIVVRSLGEYDYGILSLVRAVLAFVLVIAGFGLGQSLLKFIPVFKVARDRRGARGLVRRVAFIQGGVWAVLLAICYFGADKFESLFGYDGVGLFLWIAVALAFFEMAFLLVTHVLQAYYDTKLLTAANVASHLVFIAFLLVLLPRDWGVIGVFSAAAAGNMVATLIVLRRMMSHFAETEEVAEASGVDRRRILRFALPFAAIGVLNIIVWRQSEVLFLAHFRGAEETGFFDLAYRLPQTLLEFVPGTVWPIVMAGISEVYTRNASDLNKAIDKYYRMLFLLSAPICMTGIVLGGRLITVLYTEAMAPSAIPAQFFFAIFSVSFFGTPLSMALYVIEKSHANLIIYSVLAMINVGLDLLLIPRFGIVGAIIPVGIVILISPFAYKRVLARYVSGTRVPLGFIARCFLASSPVLLLFPFTGYIDGVFELVAAILLAAVMIVFGFKALKVIGREELAMIGAVPIPALGRFLRFLAS